MPLVFSHCLHLTQLILDTLDANPGLNLISDRRIDWKWVFVSCLFCCDAISNAELHWCVTQLTPQWLLRLHIHSLFTFSYQKILVDSRIKVHNTKCILHVRGQQLKGPCACVHKLYHYSNMQEDSPTCKILWCAKSCDVCEPQNCKRGGQTRPWLLSCGRGLCLWLCKRVTDSPESHP